jgi:hypothetical protein
MTRWQVPGALPALGAPPEGNQAGYQSLLRRRAQPAALAGFEPLWLPDFLFGFQRHLAGWAVRQGRGALLADCGLGKSAIELTWAQNVHKHTGKPVLLLTPLAVSFQMEEEAAKFGIDAAVSRDGSAPAPVTVANYERLHLFDRDAFGGAACDESSILKDFDGTRRRMITEFLRPLPYRLLATATAAPNDHTELGTSSEALGYLGHTDMLTRFFTNSRQTAARPGGLWRDGGWQLKGHARDAFWRWAASWALALRRPSDLGFSDEGYDLPPLQYRQHVAGSDQAPADGTLFSVPAAGLDEERAEARRTLRQRCQLAAELLSDGQPGVAWCQLNDEASLVEHLVDGAVQVSGADSPDAKEAKLAAFGRGEIRVLVTKPSIGARGLNWQHCAHAVYFPSHSYQDFYQAVRRMHRFGQRRPVTVDVVTAPGGARALASLQRKAELADQMFTELIAHMRDAEALARAARHSAKVEVPAWASC